MLYYLLIIVFVFSCSSIAENKKVPLEAIVRSDNDFVTYKDTVSRREQMPKAAVLKAYEIIKDTRNAENNIFSISYNNNISIYVIKLQEFPGIQYNFFVYDKENDRVSSEVVSINGKWMEDNESGFKDHSKLLYVPLISFEDIDSNGQREVVIKERAHNGNVYNALLKNYYYMDQNLNLKKVLVIEAKSIDAMSEGSFTRTLENGSIYTFYTDKKHTDSAFVGKVNLFVSKDSSNIISSEITLEKFKDFIITNSGIDQQKFIRKGYNFSY